MSHRVGRNTNLPSDSNISKAARVNINSVGIFLKEYSTSFLMVCRLIDFALVVLKLWMFKVSVIIAISEIESFNFSGTERVKAKLTLGKDPLLISRGTYKGWVS